MRSLVAIAVALIVLPLTGCLSSGPEAAADVTPDGDSPTAPPPLHPEGTPQFCAGEDACDFWDEDYHEYVVYDLDTTVLDIVILPSAGMDAVGLAASRRSVEAWEEGIRALALPWFNASFEMNVYVVGQDIPDLAAVRDPEIVVVSTGVGQDTLLGIGLEPKQIACLLREGPDAYPVHAHHGMEIRAASDCTGTGFTCFALNFAGIDQYDLYDLIAHEVGHCLGAGHVGDALDFSSRYAPLEDIMSYQSNSTQVHCVSTMNVRVLEGVYAHLLDQPEETWLPRGSYYAMSPLDYEQVTCANPN